MYVRMKADGSVTSKGFLGNFTRACGATIHTSGEGDLSSPNYPHAWENGGDCTWTAQYCEKYFKSDDLCPHK